MNTLEFVIARARRSVAWCQNYPTPEAATAARLDVITVALVQVIGGGIPPTHREVARFARLLAAPDDAYEVVAAWLDDTPDDDILDQLVAALFVLEGGEVTPEHWLRAGEESP